MWHKGYSGARLTTDDGFLTLIIVARGRFDATGLFVIVTRSATSLRANGSEIRCTFGTSLVDQIVIIR